jgi:hypothetical protein
MTVYVLSKLFVYVLLKLENASVNVLGALAKGLVRACSVYTGGVSIVHLLKQLAHYCYFGCSNASTVPLAFKG